MATLEKFVVMVMGIDEDDDPCAYVIGPFHTVDACNAYAVKHKFENDENVEDWHIFQLRSPEE